MTTLSQKIVASCSIIYTYQVSYLYLMKNCLCRIKMKRKQMQCCQPVQVLARHHFSSSFF